MSPTSSESKRPADEFKNIDDQSESQFLFGKDGDRYFLKTFTTEQASIKQEL